MRVVVINEFRDKHQFSHIYKVGEVLDFTDERSKNLLARGLVKSAEQESGKAKVDETPKAEEDLQPDEKVTATVEATETETPGDVKAQSEAKAKEAIAKARRAVKSSKK